MINDSTINFTLLPLNRLADRSEKPDEDCVHRILRLLPKNRDWHCNE